ncbi:MAG: hypothetical protein AAF658_01555 [Myxococcota bacterium]
MRAFRWVGVAVFATGALVMSQPELQALVTPAFLATVAAYDGGANLRAARLDKVQGMTISTHRIGLEWGTDIIEPTLDHISSVGANWVAIHPYASIRKDGSGVWERFDPKEYAESVQRPIREAHARGLKILVKPHLAYWGSGFSWRGEIDFEDPVALERFFTDYHRWTVHLARLSRDADAFSVGCELDELLEHEPKWRALIADVRAVTKAPLTYAANWPNYEKVRFWDALDAIGIQAYFPLSENPDPSTAELEAAWSDRMKKLRTYSAAQARTIVFTELGYNRSTDAARMPWDYRVDGSEQARLLQERCLEAALAAVDSEPSVVGSFLWKWFPEPYPNGRTYALATDEMKSLICEQWCLPVPYR